MVRVQRIIVPDTQKRCWVLFDAEHQPLIAPNQYLSYLHHLGRFTAFARNPLARTANTPQQGSSRIPTGTCTGQRPMAAPTPAPA